MANYPSVAQVKGTFMQEDDGTRVTRAVSGLPLFRNWFTTDRRTFQVIHECNNTDKQSIASHYSGDRRNSFSFTFAPTGSSYTVRYADEPKYTPIEGTYRWRVEVILIEATT